MSKSRRVVTTIDWDWRHSEGDGLEINVRADAVSNVLRLYMVRAVCNGENVAKLYVHMGTTQLARPTDEQREEIIKRVLNLSTIAHQPDVEQLSQFITFRFVLKPRPFCEQMVILLGELFAAFEIPDRYGYRRGEFRIQRYETILYMNRWMDYPDFLRAKFKLGVR